MQLNIFRKNLQLPILIWISTELMHSFQPANLQISREKLRIWIINLYKKKTVQGYVQGHDKKLFSWDDASLSTTFHFFTHSFCFYLWQKARDHYNHYHSMAG